MRRTAAQVLRLCRLPLLSDRAVAALDGLFSLRDLSMAACPGTLHFTAAAAALCKGLQGSMHHS